MPAPASCHVQSHIEQGVLVLTLTDAHLQGDALAHVLRKELLAATDQTGLTKVILDFRRVQVLGSEAFRPPLSLRRHLEEAGGRLMLCNLSPTVAQSFQATRLMSSSRTSTARFDVQSNMAAAVASLSRAATEP